QRRRDPTPEKSPHSARSRTALQWLLGVLGFPCRRPIPFQMHRRARPPFQRILYSLEKSHPGGIPPIQARKRARELKRELRFGPRLGRSAALRQTRIPPPTKKPPMGSAHYWLRATRRCASG